MYLFSTTTSHGYGPFHEVSIIRCKVDSFLYVRPKVTFKLFPRDNVLADIACSAVFSAYVSYKLSHQGEKYTPRLTTKEHLFECSEPFHSSIDRKSRFYIDSIDAFISSIPSKLSSLSKLEISDFDSLSHFTKDSMRPILAMMIFYLAKEIYLSYKALKIPSIPVEKYDPHLYFSNLPLTSSDKFDYGFYRRLLNFFLALIRAGVLLWLIFYLL